MARGKTATTKSTSSDDDIDSIAERAAAEVRERAGVEDTEEEERPEPKSRDVVDLDELEDDDEDGEEVEVRKPTARQKKTQRFRQLQEEKLEAERRMRELEAERDRERLRAESLALLARQPQQQQEDELEKKQKALWQEKTDIFSTFENLTPEGKSANFEKMQERLRDIDFEMADLAAEKRLRKMNLQQPQQSQGDLILATQFPDVASHRNGSRLVALHYDRLRLRGHADSPETLKLAAEAAREDIPELSGRNRGRTNLRERLSSTSTGPSLRSNGQGQKPNRVFDFSGKDKLSKAHRDMAEAMYPNDEPRVAWTKWAKKVGTKLPG